MIHEISILPSLNNEKEKKEQRHPVIQEGSLPIEAKGTNNRDETHSFLETSEVMSLHFKYHPLTSIH